jgi:molecular chaperone DnaJ
MPEKLYEVLGIPDDASTADVEAAYRRKVKETHPDLSDDPDADERFQLVVRAKEVLTDDEERELYDDLGHKLYMDMFDEDGEGSSGSGKRDRSGAGSAGAGGTSSGTTSGSSATGSGSGSSGSRSESSRKTRPTGAASVNSSTTGSSSSEASSSESSGSSSSGESSASGSPSESSGTSASGASGTGPSGRSNAGGASTGGGASERSARGATGGVSERTVAQEAERTRKKWQAAARSGDTPGGDGPWSTSSSQGDHLAAERVQGGIATKIRSQDVAEMTIVMLVVYPIFVFATVWPTFHPVVNAFIGLVTVGVVMYTLTEPLVSLVVFGTWSVLTPLLLVFINLGVLTPGGLFALTVTWVPFMLAFLLTLAMPDG